MKTLRQFIETEWRGGLIEYSDYASKSIEIRELINEGLIEILLRCFCPEGHTVSNETVRTERFFCSECDLSYCVDFDLEKHWYIKPLTEPVRIPTFERDGKTYYKLSKITDLAFLPSDLWEAACEDIKPQIALMRTMFAACTPEEKQALIESMEDYMEWCHDPPGEDKEFRLKVGDKAGMAVKYTGFEEGLKYD